MYAEQWVTYVRFRDLEHAAVILEDTAGFMSTRQLVECCNLFFRFLFVSVFFSFLLKSFLSDVRSCLVCSLLV